MKSISSFFFSTFNQLIYSFPFFRLQLRFALPRAPPSAWVKICEFAILLHFSLNFFSKGPLCPWKVFQGFLGDVYIGRITWLWWTFWRFYCCIFWFWKMCLGSLIWHLWSYVPQMSWCFIVSDFFSLLVSCRFWLIVTPGNWLSDVEPSSLSEEGNTFQRICSVQAHVEIYLWNPSKHFLPVGTGSGGLCSTISSLGPWLPPQGAWTSSCLEWGPRRSGGRGS